MQTAKVIAVPPPQKAPVLTRRQVLEKEINREKVGLKSAQSQLASAKKKGNQSAANRFAALVIDRQQNIAALEAEMRR